ncbi:hypothetical protein C3920_11620 [Novacetimonas pomaceti]|uniref:Uncharacterized protein n=2 Tax=Novacetimonas pomaceti TaxID=2021998 RepID=A0ABX5P025_9PROT|nr:hypothetical protein C3920_11620 [Novacetimonas pomaceti]
MQIVDAENRVLAQINHVDGSWNDINSSDEDGELDPKSISQFNHWLSNLPAVGTAAAGNSTRLMTCSFDYSQLVQTKDGSGAIGAVRKPGSSQFGAQARFQQAEGLKSMVNVNLVLNIASQLLAQKHLADINARLQTIEQKVDAIQAHLEMSRFAQIRTLREHLHIIGKLLDSGAEITKDTLQNLAKNAQEVRSQVIHIREDITAADIEIERFNPVSWFGSDDLRDKLNQKVKNIERLQREYFIGMKCLLMANLILFIKNGGNKEFVFVCENYLNEINDENGVMQKWGKTKRKVANHLSKMKPIFERAISSQANALQVERRIRQVDNLLCIDKTQIMQMNDQIAAAQSPQVILEIVDGKVRRGRYLN